MCQCHTAPTAREGIVDDSISGRTILIIQVVIYLYHLLQLFQDSIINPFPVERKIGNVCFLSVRHTLSTPGAESMVGLEGLQLLQPRLPPLDP